MGKKRTTNEFIEEARVKHGDKYDYSKSVYTMARNNVIIICPSHGEFNQTPTNHLIGYGCRQCGYLRIAKRKAVTNEEFIEKARNKHGNKYDYSKVKYVNSLTKVIIICETHGEFEQVPPSHLSGSGCPSCYGSYQKTTEEFIKDAQTIHGDIYDYSETDYIKASARVKIICKKHGEFIQIPNNHLKGYGCPACGNIKQGLAQRSNSREFIERAKNTHGNKYDYSKTVYVKNHSKVIIICPEHGEFSQRPSKHLFGRGCSKCKGGVKISKEKFIINAKKVHGEIYDYSLVDYVNAKTKVKIICSVHGEFEQIPDVHTRGCGCPTCNSSKGGLAVSKYLAEQGVNFKPEKRFKDCKHKYTLPFDFYIPKINLLIEFDGEQHYKPVEVFGGEEAFEKQQIKDAIKNKYAKDNGYHLVRIRDINSVEIVLKPYIELYNTENPENYVVCNGELFYDDLD